MTRRLTRRLTRSAARTLFLAASLLAAGVMAQERGRTDGPEGSEIGKGGYQRLNASRFSLNLNWGAALDFSPIGGTPMFVGLDFAWWGDEWYQIELGADYIFNSQRVDIQVGPRFRTPFFPVSFSGALKAGAVIFAPVGAVRFLLTPEVGVDLMIVNHVIVGIAYGLDIPLGGGSLVNKVFLNIGYRF
ncbi:MAG: hypothetical protein ACKVPX_07685 [Myxococcaceae bacterium]